MWTREARDREILDAARTALLRTAGLDAAVCKDTPDKTILEITAHRKKRRFAANIQTVERFTVPAAVKAIAQRGEYPTLLVAPYITREMAKRCRELHLPFIDAAGNALIETPELFLYVTGEPRPETPRQQTFRALNPAGLQIVFALLCNQDLVCTNYREIAQRAGVALGTVGPVIKDLERRGYLRYQNEKTPRMMHHEKLLQEWITHYPVTLRPKLHAHRFRAGIEPLRQMDLAPLHALWGGEPAAERLTHYLKPAHYTIYAEQPITKLVAAGRMAADAAGNVEILDRFWNFAPEPAHPDVAPPILVYADLLATNDPRDLETARMIHEQHIVPAIA